MYEVILQAYLDSTNRTQYWLAKKSGLTTNTLSRICNGEQKFLRLDTVYKICTALGCTPNDILANEEGIPLNKIAVNNHAIPDCYKIRFEASNNEQTTTPTIARTDHTALMKDLSQVRSMAQQTLDMTDNITNKYFGKTYIELFRELDKKSDSGDAK